MLERRLPWVLLGFAFALAPFLYAARGERPHIGGTLDASLTLITADKLDLSCALPRAAAGYRCEYPAPQREWPPSEAALRAHVLQPFVTVQGMMYLVPGLFEQPALARRFERERPDGRSRNDYHRFTAACRLTIRARLEADAFVRFGRDAPWGAAPPLWVAEASACQVSDE